MVEVVVGSSWEGFGRGSRFEFKYRTLASRMKMRHLLWEPRRRWHLSFFQNSAQSDQLTIFFNAHFSPGNDLDAKEMILILPCKNMPVADAAAVLDPICDFGSVCVVAIIRYVDSKYCECQVLRCCKRVLSFFLLHAISVFLPANIDLLLFSNRIILFDDSRFWHT